MSAEKENLSHIPKSNPLAFNQAFEKLYDFPPHIKFVLNDLGTILHLNHSVQTILGFKEEDLIGKCIYDFIHQEDKLNTIESVAQVIQEQTIINLDNRFLQKNGEFLYLSWTITADNGNIYGLARNHSEIHQAAFIKSEKKFTSVFQNSPLPIIVWDYDTKKIIDCNEKASLKYGYTKDEFTNLYIKDISLANKAETQIPFHSLKSEKSLDENIWQHRKKSGEVIYMEISRHLLELHDNKVVVAFCNDVTDRIYYEHLDHLEINILEMNAGREKELVEMINIYLAGIESIHAGMSTSIQEKRNEQLFSFCSPSLPEAYLNSIDGAYIGTNTGSCGTAAFLKEKVIVSDIENDIRWVKYKETAGKFDLKACWSYPILNGKGEVMATFACYYKEKKTPSPFEENTVQRAVHILQIILESYDRRNHLQTSNERFEYVTEATSDVIWDWDLKTNQVFYSKNIYKLFGHQLGPNNDNMPFYLKNVHPDDRGSLVLDPEEIMYSKMVNWTQEYRFRKADGEYAFVLDKGIVIRDQKGVGTRMVGAMQDITKQKIEDLQIALIAEIGKIFNETTDLNQSLTQILRRLLDFGKCSIAEAWLVRTDKSQIVLAAKYPKSESMQLFYDGKSEIKYFNKGEGLPGIVWETGEIKFWKDLEDNKDFFRRDVAKKVGLKSAYGIPLKYNNEIIGVFLIGLSRTEKIEQPFISFFENYSAHFGAEIKRKQLEQELNQIFDYVPDVICVGGFDGFYKKVNPAMCALLEYSEAELLSKSYMDFVHPLDIENSLNEVKHIKEGKTTFYFENRHITKTGKIKWLAWTTTPAPEAGLFFGVAKDITEKKELENLLDKASKLAEIGSWEIDLSKDLLFWSKMTRDIYEVDSDFIPTAETTLNFYRDQKDKDLIINSITDAVEKGTHFDIELKIITQKGNHKWVRIIGEPEFINNECIRVYGSLQNIDEKKRGILSLEEAKQRYSELFHLSPLPMFVVDYVTLQFIDVNMACIQHYGYTRDEFLKITLRDIVSESDNAHLENEFWKDENIQGNNYKGTYTHIKKNGETIKVDIQSNTIFYSGKKAKVGLVNDITDRLNYIKAIEEQNKKLTEISWIQSHVIRAPLARIMGLIQLINDTEQSEKDKMEINNYILHSANELDDVISNISEKTKRVDF